MQYYFQYFFQFREISRNWKQNFVYSSFVFHEMRETQVCGTLDRDRKTRLTRQRSENETIEAEQRCSLRQRQKNEAHSDRGRKTMITPTEQENEARSDRGRKTRLTSTEAEN
jgi:hypothetical protein